MAQLGLGVWAEGRWEPFCITAAWGFQNPFLGWDPRMKGVEPGVLRMKSKTKTSAGKLWAEQTWRPRQPKRC